MLCNSIINAICLFILTPVAHAITAANPQFTKAVLIKTLGISLERLSPQNKGASQWIRLLWSL